MTPRQRDVLVFLVRYMHESGGVSPSYREIAEGVGCSSRSHVGEQLDALCAEGYVVRGPGRARCLRVAKIFPGMRSAVPEAFTFKAQWWPAEDLGLNYDPRKPQRIITVRRLGPRKELTA